MKKVLSISLLSLMLFVACNKKAEEKPADTSASTEAPAATTTVESNVVTNAPAGCVQENTAATTESSLKEPVKFLAKNSWFVQSTPDSGTFYFANYEGFDPQDAYGHTYADADITTYFDITTKDKSALAKGVWNYGADENNKLGSVSISMKDSSRGVLSNKGGKLELTYVGTDYVCGNVDIDDGYGSIKGDFIAKFYQWKSSF